MDNDQADIIRRLNQHRLSVDGIYGAITRRSSARASVSSQGRLDGETPEPISPANDQDAFEDPVYESLRKETSCHATALRNLRRMSGLTDFEKGLDLSYQIGIDDDLKDLEEEVEEVEDPDAQPDITLTHDDINNTWEGMLDTKVPASAMPADAFNSMSHIVSDAIQDLEDNADDIQLNETNQQDMNEFIQKLNEKLGESDNIDSSQLLNQSQKSQMLQAEAERMDQLREEKARLKQEKHMRKINEEDDDGIAPVAIEPELTDEQRLALLREELAAHTDLTMPVDENNNAPSSREEDLALKVEEDSDIDFSASDDDIEDVNVVPDEMEDFMTNFNGEGQPEVRIQGQQPKPKKKKRTPAEKAIRAQKKEERRLRKEQKRIEKEKKDRERKMSHQRRRKTSGRAVKLNRLKMGERIDDLPVDTPRADATFSKVDFLKASAHGRQKVVMKYIQDGGDVNAQDEHKRTALQRASLFGEMEVIDLLVSKKAKMNISDKLGDTALHWACRGGSSEVVRKLVKNGCKVNAKDKLLSTPLHVAIRCDVQEVITTLLKLGADINARDIEGDTPMHDAVRLGKFKVIKHLLAAGASLKLKNKNNQTPIDMVNLWIAETKHRKQNLQANEIMEAMSNHKEKEFPKSKLIGSKAF